MSREDDESPSKVQQMMDQAQPASYDTEAKLILLQELAEARKPNPVIEAEYERLRDELADQIEREGPRYYLDRNGIKRFAYVMTRAPIDVDVRALIKANQDGRITDAVLDEAAPRKVDMEGFRRAAARGSNPNSRKPGIPTDVLVEVARKRKGTSVVKFSQPVDPADR